jgi:hypothetical protein
MLFPLPYQTARTRRDTLVQIFKRDSKTRSDLARRLVLEISKAFERTEEMTHESMGRRRPMPHGR